MNKLKTIFSISLFLISVTISCMEEREHADIDQHEIGTTGQLSFQAQEENALIKQIQENANWNLTRPTNTKFYPHAEKKDKIIKAFQKIAQLRSPSRQWRVITSRPNILTKAIENLNHEFVDIILVAINKFEPEDQIKFITEAIENYLNNPENRDKLIRRNAAFEMVKKWRDNLAKELQTAQAQGRKMAKLREEDLQKLISEKEELGISHYTEFLPGEISERISQFYRPGAAKFYAKFLEEEAKLADGLDAAATSWVSSPKYEAGVKQAFNEIAKLSPGRQRRTLSKLNLSGKLAKHDKKFKRLFIDFIAQQFDPKDQLKILYNSRAAGTSEIIRSRIHELENFKTALTENEKQIAKTLDTAKLSYNIGELRQVAEEIKKLPIDKIVAILLGEQKF